MNSVWPLMRIEFPSRMLKRSGKAGDKVIKVLFDCIAAGDVAGALRIVEESLAIGSDIGHLFNDILEYIRNLLLLGAPMRHDI